MKQKTIDLLREWVEEYNDPKYFEEDPIAFPREFVRRGASLQDVEIAAIFAAHLAWGRRPMIIRDCQRLFDEMGWQPYDYVMSGSYRDDETSLHRTVKWSETAAICGRLREWYSWHETLETLSAKEIRSIIFRRKDDPKAPDKKINLMRRWMVRNDGKVDLGLWKKTSPKDLVVPLDVHVYGQATALGLTKRRQKDLRTAMEITDRFREIWPDDPVLGDFALFGYGVTHNG
jgi:uncharacterized protein (TIGR02757 family)